MASAREFPERVCAERDQHEADREFERPLRTRADLDVEQEYGAARDEQRTGVTDSPETADKRRTPDALPLAHNRRDGGQVVGLDRVPETLHEAECEYGNG